VNGEWGVVSDFSIRAEFIHHSPLTIHRSNPILITVNQHISSDNGGSYILYICGGLDRTHFPANIFTSGVGLLNFLYLGGSFFSDLHVLNHEPYPPENINYRLESMLLNL
jgi:hypothetical protein